MAIIFQSDWFDEQDRPCAIVHSSTTNHSFRRMAVVLRTMNIKNNLFHLGLYDPKLLNVDPHKLNADNDPDGELRLRVAVESNRNIWYYLREVLLVPTDGDDPVRFRLNRGNLAMVWCFLCHLDYNSTQPRQSGKAQPLYSLIKTPTGWTYMGDIKIGDRVTAADGTTTSVTQVYPQGFKHIYRITFEDGRYTDCCAEHLWRTYDRYGSVASTHARTVSLQAIRDKLLTQVTTEAGLCIPLVTPEIKYAVDLPLDPYVLGALLGKDGYNKVIPAVYLAASASQRLSLLQGLLDTQGTVNQSGHISYRTTSEVLAKQVQYLIRSLGGICKIQPRQTYYTYHGEYGKTRPSYQLNIRMHAPKTLFSLSSKRNRLADTYKSSDKLRLGIKSITYIGRRAAQCIEIAHPDHLYITDDFIVTHNTISAISITSWIMYIFGWHMAMGMLTHSADLVQANVKRLKAMKDALPSYLIHRGSELDVDNKEGLDYKALFNTYYTYIGQKDRSAARRVGRGKTGANLHIDEIAYIPNIKITFPAIMATTNTARINAKRVGQPYSNLYTTTAADPLTEEGAFAFDLVTKAMPFTEKLYDCANEAAAHEMVRSNSSNNLVNGTFSYLQLGYTHAWFHATIARNNVPPDEVERDYLNHWISAAQFPILSKTLLTKMNNSKVEPHHVEVFGAYVIQWYVPQEVSASASFRNSPIILGMDSSEAIGRDFTTFVGILPKTLQTVCTFRCNDANITKIALFVAQLLIEFPRMIFVPERKSTGAAIIDLVITVLLREGHNPFFRIFNQIVDRYEQDEFARYDLHDRSLSDSTARRYLGFMTGETTRKFLYKQILQHAGELAADKMFDRVLVTEIAGLQSINGRIDHRSGHHDDMVIAWLLACYLVLEGKNLHYYGLTTEELLANTVTSERNLPDNQHITQQLALRKQIQELEAQARASTNAAVRAHFSYKIAQLQHYVDPTLHIEPTSVEAVRRNTAGFNPSAELSRVTVHPREFFDALYL